MSHIAGQSTGYTAGTTVIEQVANGFIVTLPERPKNLYAGLAPEMTGALREIGRDETLNTEVDQEPVNPGYEMSAIGNVFIFKTYAQVISFLEKKLKPVIETE